MDQRFAYLMFVGLAIGALLGLGVGSANGNALIGLGIGAAIGAAIGWFAAAAATERQKPE